MPLDKKAEALAFAVEVQKLVNGIPRDIERVMLICQAAVREHDVLGLYAPIVYLKTLGIDTLKGLSESPVLAYKQLRAKWMSNDYRNQLLSTLAPLTGDNPSEE